MKNYKKLIIPDRLPRTVDRIINKQLNYCKKTKCGGVMDGCVECLFDIRNIDIFQEWYLNKNKRGK